MGWWMAVMYTILSIAFELSFIPGIRVWYDIKQNPARKVTEIGVEKPDDKPVDPTKPDDPTPPDGKDDIDNTTFFRDIVFDI